jgi:asparagine synthase (glutamine-hydrolysing)
MCGIAGAIGDCGPAVQAAVGYMQQAMVHRGPDDAGQWQCTDDAQRGVALAHRRLAILDLSPRGRQPMRDAHTGHVVVFNGEIYNFKALRRELQHAGAAFDTDTDTEVILKAYAQWGIDCVARLQGMFAFALWDAAEGMLHLVRDRLGVKPLYYTTVDAGDGRATVLFASEVRALLASGRVARQIDPTAMAQTVWHGFTIEPRTMVAGVRALPPGHRTLATPNGTMHTPQGYWHPPRATAPGADARDGQAAVTAALTQSIESRLISDAPLGVFLSGGVDSTAVAAVAARATDQPLRTFSVTFDESGYDESAYARQVAKHLGTDHQELHLTEAQFDAQLDDALASLDQPSFDALNTYIISRTVRQAGLTVALAGTGGDELFGGYRSFVDLPWARRWAQAMRALPAPMKRAVAQPVTRWRTGRPGAVPPQARWGKLADALTTHGELAALYQTDYALFTRAFFDRLLTHDQGRDLCFGLEPDQYADRKQMAETSAGSTWSAVSHLERASFLQQRLLRDTDAVSMASSLEVRVPLIDHTVWQAAATLDDRDRFAPIGHKQLLRQLTAPEVPPAIFDRPKAGFVLPLERWARTRLWRQVDDTLRDARLCQSVGLCPDAVGQLWQAFQEGAPGIYWSRIWAIFTLLRWCARHGVTLEGPASKHTSAPATSLSDV